MAVFESRVEVLGTRHRRADADAFARGKEHELDLVVEPDRLHEGGSIRVVGVTRGWLFTKRRVLGYVPHATVASLSRKGLSGKAQARLTSVWSPGNGYVVVRFDVLVPAPGEPGGG
jgi:hypothetical protein